MNRAALLAAHLEMETEGERILVAAPQPVDTTMLDRVTELLDTGATARVLRLTPNQWREMGPHQRRAMLDFAVARAKVLDERIAFMSRNIVAGDFEMPAHLRDSGAL